MTFGRAATRIYILALRAFPRRHRTAYAAEMIDTFEQELAAQTRGPATWRTLLFVVAAWLNVVSAGLVHDCHGSLERPARAELLAPKHRHDIRACRATQWNVRGERRCADEQHTSDDEAQRVKGLDLEQHPP